MTTHYRRPQKEPYVDEVSICGTYLTPGVWRCEYASMTTCEACLEALAREAHLDHIAAIRKRLGGSATRDEEDPRTGRR